MDSEFRTMMPATRSRLESEGVFLGLSTFLFIVCVALTIYWQGSMPAGTQIPDGMPMSDTMSMSNNMPTSGDTVSMMLTKPAGQFWLVAGGSFESMWVVMMVAMMLPSLAPTLLAYRHSVGEPGQGRLNEMTVFAFAGYYFAWAIFGIIAYVLSVAVTGAESQIAGLAKWLPAATGAILVLGGFFQLSAWKARQLRCCRDTADWARSLPQNDRGSWQYGLRLGYHCCLCCAGYMVALLIAGMMNLGIMAIVGILITLERLAPRPILIARIVGIISLVAGATLIARSLFLA